MNAIEIRPIFVFVLVAILAGGGCGNQHDNNGNDQSRNVSLEMEPAATSVDPVVALRRLMNDHAAQGEYEKAADVALALAESAVADPVSELQLAFNWHMHAANVVEAEQDMMRAIAIAPDDPRGHRGMAELLNAQGRRFEARRHTLEIAKLNVITQRELLSLIDTSGPFELVSFRTILDPTTTNVFDLCKARYEYVGGENLALAIATLDRLHFAGPLSPAIEAFRGQLLAETRDSDRFQMWLAEVPDGAPEYPEYWSAVGLWLVHLGRDQEAIHAFGEVLLRDPTARSALRSILSALTRIGDSEKLSVVQETLAALDRIFRIASMANSDHAVEIGNQLQKLGRPWEANGWYRIAFEQGNSPYSRFQELQQRQEKIRIWETKAGAANIGLARVNTMLGFDFRDYPKPNLNSLAISNDAVERNSFLHPLLFHDIAPKVGLTSSFASGYSVNSGNFLLHQANGGGIAALDFDLDGRCDLYMAQSDGDPNKHKSSVANELYRHLPEARFDEVGGASLTADQGFGQGVCAADVNQDGFPDLLVANIGSNVLYINQGDGTFRERSDLLMDPADEKWTSSIAVADLSGDGLPEIIEVNYVDDPLIFQRPCRGKSLDCTPQRFRAATDRIRRSLGDGRFRSWSGADQIDKLPNYGFGIVVTDFDGKDGNDIFVANDGDLNHFWKSVSAIAGTIDDFELTEVAGLVGCSVGAKGLSQGCMGTTTGDFDRNGFLDVAITNFYNEPMNLFLQEPSGLFIDQSYNYGLVDPSKDVLGFGIQADDFDNDGWLDLAILNGHIYDARYADIPFQMAAQLVRGGSSGFLTQDPLIGGPYWQRRQLGRTLAKFDWNRDGRIDLVANHLDQPTAILQNDTIAENWMQLELVGVQSERDAIGARVVIRVGEEEWTLWQTAGDGYMCTNESMLHVGIGSAIAVDQIEITWPSGSFQIHESLLANHRYLFVEGQKIPTPRRLPHD
ncbi:FG-GAP-like repeat-containing protein [Rubripirellula reticaptiva]|nr:FG-GAP-like repeat-containing protein [Rubripirellula reticaptiva]